MRIFGEVLDGNTNEPLGGVTLRISQAEGGVKVPNIITNRAGKFEVEDGNIMPEAMVDFVLNGYQDKSLTANKLEGEPIFLYSVMSEEGMPLEGEIEMPTTQPIQNLPEESNAKYILVGLAALGLLFLMFRKKK